MKIKIIRVVIIFMGSKSIYEKIGTGTYLLFCKLIFRVANNIDICSYDAYSFAFLLNTKRNALIKADTPLTFYL